MIQSRIYFKNLDGLRFFAAVVVICAHYITVLGDTMQSGKWSRIILTLDGSGAEIGVNFFFVLSGFLITYLILTDTETTNISYVKKFYIRRVLRIWPLYFLSIAIGFFLYPILSEIPQYVEVASGWMYTLFLANLDQIYFWNNPVNHNTLLGVHWSFI
jgi:peptidoglycan/LPS O-acetylase OafA/YrhL